MSVLITKHIVEIVAAVMAGIAIYYASKFINTKIVHEKIKLGINVFRVLGIASVVFSLLICIVTDHVLYHISFNLDAYVQLQQSDSFEELKLNTPIGKCSGWMYHSMHDAEVTVILFPGNMYASEEMMGSSVMFDEGNGKSGVNFIALDYPGYGRCDGIPSESTIKLMALSAFDELMTRNDMKDQKIVLMGYSLGTGVANYVASKRDVDGMILIAPYKNGHELFNKFINIFNGPLKLFNPYKMRADLFAENIKVKPLVIATKDDTMISYESSSELAQIYPQGSDMKLYDGLGHGGFWSDNQVWQDILSYLSEITNK